MSIIKASIVEIEVQEQSAPDAGAKYMVVVRYEPDGKQQSDILQLLITNQKPIVKQTLDLGDRIVEKNVATTTKPKDVTTPEQIFGLEDTHE
jgi:hypothetical protein